MEDKIQKIEREIETIKERNLRVEADKAWETSSFRIFFYYNNYLHYCIARFVFYRCKKFFTQRTCSNSRIFSFHTILAGNKKVVD